MDEPVWTLQIHTCEEDGSQPDDAVGNDWTIQKDGRAMFYEGGDLLTLGEARQLHDLLQRAGWAGDWHKGARRRKVMRWIRGARFAVRHRLWRLRVAVFGRTAKEQAKLDADLRSINEFFARKGADHG